MSNTNAVKLPTACAECGKRTNKVNRSEQNPELCKTCFTQAELEVSHQDGHHTEFVKGCFHCNDERNKAMEDNELGDHWVNVHARRQPKCTTCDLVADRDRGEVDPIWYEGPVPSPSDQAAIDAVTQETKRGRFDHSSCNHPKTAKDRAQCRKTGAAAVFYGVIEEPVIDEEPSITEAIDQEDRWGAPGSEADFLD